MPDLPFPDSLGVKYGEHIPGTALHEYLQLYAQQWDIDHRIRFQTRVKDVEKLDDGWLLNVKAEDREYQLSTRKLIVATGLTSQVQPMNVKGQESFNAPMMNTSEMATTVPLVVKDPTVERVTVFGGSKSAWDAVYMFASAGKEIDWVIRKSGHGPTWMGVSHMNLGPFGRFWLESLVTRRILACMSPCIWGGLDGSSGWRSFLHQTWLGKKIVDTFWWKIGADTLEQSGYNNHPNLKALKPDCSIFEVATAFAVQNYPTDILEFVRSGQVKVYREDLSHLSDHTVHLSNGTSLQSDAFIASTGWLYGPAVNFKDTSLHSDLGIPSTDYTESQKTFWADLDIKADDEIFGKWPQLASLKYPPRSSDDLKENPLDEEDGMKPRKDFQPIRLYRSLVPPGLAAKGDRSLAFAGLCANFNGHLRNEVAGTWIYAYMSDKLAIDPCRDVEDVHYQAALFNRFCYRRYPYGFGRRFPDFVFDAVPWFDVLLNDLGISVMRKGGSWHREMFEPYGVQDYRGITEEWLAKNKKVCDGKIN